MLGSGLAYCIAMYRQKAFRSITVKHLINFACKRFNIRYAYYSQNRVHFGIKRAWMYTLLLMAFKQKKL